jgi:hypothetical protein
VEICRHVLTKPKWNAGCIKKAERPRCYDFSERHGREMAQHTKAKCVQAVYVSDGRIRVLWSKWAEKRK